MKFEIDISEDDFERMKKLFHDDGAEVDEMTDEQIIQECFHIDGVR